jgi:uncharacterized repeat protein (TIGR03803 family)
MSLFGGRPDHGADASGRGQAQGSSDGYLYGTTTIGGTNGHGTVYKFNPSTYAWSISNGTITAGQGTPSIQWVAASPGTVSICLTNTDSPVCTNTICTTVIAYSGAIAAGGESSVALRPDGSLWAWGRNDGNLGDGLDSGIQPNGDYVEEYLPYPSDLASASSCAAQAITNAVAVATGGDDFTLVVDNAGGLWSFGENTAGQLGADLGGFDETTGGFNDTNLYPSPIRVGGLSSIVSVSAGLYHALALRADGTVFAWGSDGAEPLDSSIYGQLGVGGLVSGETNAPVQSTNLTQIVAIAAGAYHSVALDASGHVWTFGQGLDGQLGNGANTNVYVPTALTTISNVVAIAAGSYHTIALTADRTCWTWGDDYHGKLGRTGNNKLPGQVSPSALSNVVAIAGGDSFSLAVDAAGRVYAWGDNSQAQLATNAADVPYTNSPIPVAGISNAVLVAAPVKGDSANDFGDAGGAHVLVTTLDGGADRYFGWGDSDDGEVGNGLSGYAAGAHGTNGASQFTPAQLQFCTRCQREVQLGTGGVFTAQCNGTLYLYFNGEVGMFGNYSGSYTATVNNVTTNVPAHDSNGYGIGISVGTVTQGSNYTYTATGHCVYSGTGAQTDPRGMDITSSNLVDCSDFSLINITNAVCPARQCFSLIGKIQ